MQISQVEREDWKKAMLTYLVACSNAPHPSSSVPSRVVILKKTTHKLPVDLASLMFKTLTFTIKALSGSGTSFNCITNKFQALNN